MWVCPNSRVVMGSINTDQTDGTFGIINNDECSFNHLSADLELNTLMLAGLILLALLTNN